MFLINFEQRIAGLTAKFIYSAGTLKGLMV
jgi:hypothetical protein